MREKKDALKGKKAVKCTPVDWDSYRIKKEDSDNSKGKNKKKQYEWDRPVVDEKWNIDQTTEFDYDFEDIDAKDAMQAVSDRKLKDDDGVVKNANESVPEPEPQGSIFEKLGVDKHESKDEIHEITVKKKRKSLDDKLAELREESVRATIKDEQIDAIESVSAKSKSRGGNFSLNDKEIGGLEDSIIGAVSDIQDDFLNWKITS